MNSYNIYCISNSSDKIHFDNDLTSFVNALPKNLDLKTGQWEIGIVKFGFQFDLSQTRFPPLVSISTDVVIDVPNGSKYSTLVYDTSLFKSELKKYFYHYVKHIKYYPIRNTFLDTIKLEFLDDKGKKLALNKGQPSFVHFHLKTMSPRRIFKTHYIRVDSETDNLTDYQNTNNNFWTHLKHPLELDENSKVALVDISFPNSIKNIGSSLNKKKINLLFKYQDQNYSHIFNIPTGRYIKGKSLVQALNSQLTGLLPQLVKFSITENNKLKIEIINDDISTFVIEIPNEFKEILGLTDADPLNQFQLMPGNEKLGIVLHQANRFYIGLNPINTMHDYPGVMLCHTNFVQHSIVGNSFAPILKIIPTQNSSKDDYISVHFDNLEFIKTNTEYLKGLNFQLKRLNGEFIEFSDNRKIILNFVVKN